MTAASASASTDLDLLGVFHSSDGRLSPSALRHAARTGRLYCVRRGWYVDAARWAADDLSPGAARQRLRIATVAAVLDHPGSAASHLSAAALCDIPFWMAAPELPCVTFTPKMHGIGVNVHVHRARMPATHVADGRVPTLTAARTILDIAREHGIWNAVVAGDFALSKGLTTRDQLMKVSKECARFPGIRRARGVIDLFDARAESPLESASRLRLMRLPLPQPTPQVDIYDEDGRFVGRVDYYWEDLGIAGEVDGKIKYESGRALVEEKRREDDLRETGLVVVRWGKPEIDNPELLLRKLSRAETAARRRHPLDRRWTAVPRGDRDHPAATLYM